MGQAFRLVVLSLLLAGWAVAAAGQVVGEDAVVRPVQIAEPPKIDGVLDEAMWAEIEPVSDFRQYEPDNGEPATERTEVRIGYDRRFLYFGVRGYDSEPQKIRARTFERDGNVDQDDSFTIAIDSRNDNRTAVAFDTNLLGTQLDVQYSESGAWNQSWDAIWYAKGQIDDQGFTLEIAIPFFSLRFEPADEVEMGLNLERIIRRKNEKVNWPHLPRDFDFINVSQYGRMVGLVDIERGVDLQLKPYGIGGYSRTPETSQSEADAGLDVKWGLSSGVTVDLTANPDFAQVESDELRVNLTRFDLFFPEKREFFIESKDLFEFGNPQSAEVFFSRRIGIRDGSEVPILGGARAYGLVGDLNLGLLTIQTREDDGVGGENFSVARLRQNILGRSYLGGIVTSRRGDDSSEDTTVGGDFMFLFGKNFEIRGHLARSGRTGVDEGQWMGHLGVSHSRDLYDWTVRYDDIGAGFDPGIGFVARPDQRTVTANGHFKPRPDWDGVRQLTFGNLFRRIENHDGVVETRTIRPGMIVMLQSEDWLMALYEDTRDRVPLAFAVAPEVNIPAGEYDNRQLHLTAQTNSSRRLWLRAEYTGGSYYGGDIQSAALKLAFKPVPQLHLLAEQYLDSVDVPDGSFDSLISRLELSFHFSPRLTTRAAAQYSSLLEDFVLNFRLRLIYAPESEVWLVYDEGRRFDRPSDSLQDRALILKLVHNLNF